MTRVRGSGMSSVWWCFAWKMAVVNVVLLTSCVFYCCYGQSYPFKNISLSFEERVKDLVDRLTLDEMVLQIAHGGARNNGPAPAITRLGINPYQWGTVCDHGDVETGPATSFPQPLGMAASFNYDLVYKVSRAISDEVRAKNNYYSAKGMYQYLTGLSCWSPNINIVRDPRWGRNQETFGEDPWLSGYLATAYITGIQGDHPRYLEANTGCRHFDVHGGPENIPVSRFSFDAKVSEQDWRMTFLPQFKACVKAGSQSLMCSYNSINGVPACANKLLLTDILRNELKFQGYVVSDQGAIENIMSQHNYTKTVLETAAAAINAGTCLEDGNSLDNTFSHLGEAVKAGLVEEDTVKDCVSRLFMVRMKLGEFDPPEMNPYKQLNASDYVQSKDHIQLAREMAAQSIVLLKNDQHNGLPIRSPYKKACVIGPFIDASNLLFGDYSPTIMESYVVTPLKGITKSGKIASNVANATGCLDGPVCKNYSSSDINQACNGADVAVVCLGTGNVLESEGRDRMDLNLPGYQFQLLQDAVNSATATILVLYNAGPLDISWAVNNNKVIAILESFFPAQEGGSALVDVLIGAVSPAGRLPNTWPSSLDHIPDITNYTMVNRTYRYYEEIPLFPFGYGLSYTTFLYSGLEITPTTVKAGQNVTVNAMVKNTGSLTSDEVVQVYVSWSNIEIAPLRQLVGIKRVPLISPSTSAKVAFTITADQMMVYNTMWYVPATKYTVFVGGQQPGQKIHAPSNVLTGSFVVQVD